jgi:hypothetical protein
MLEFISSFSDVIALVIGQGMQIMKLLIMQFSPFCYFLCNRSKYTSEHCTHIKWNESCSVWLLIYHSSPKARSNKAVCRNINFVMVLALLKYLTR